MFVPIFEKDGNKLFITTPDFIGTSETHADMIGLAASIVEGVLLDMKYIGTMEIEPDLTPHRKAHVGNVPIAIISGPMFDEVI